MFYQYDNKEHEEKAKEVLSGLGEFVIAFERVCAEMRSVILCIFRKEGLKNQGLSQIVVNKSAAEALRTSLGGLYSELRDQDEKDIKLVKQLLSRVDKLGSIRNKLLHAEWFLNYDYENANDKFTALALKHSTSQNSGAYSLTIPVSKESLNAHVREATEIQVMMRRFGLCMNQNGLKISDVLSKPLYIA